MYWIFSECNDVYEKKMDMFYIMNNFPIGGIYTCQLSNIIAYNRILYSTWIVCLQVAVKQKFHVFYH